jgi:hypothetical protein
MEVNFGQLKQEINRTQLEDMRGLRRPDHTENVDIRKQLEIQAVQNKIDKLRQNGVNNLHGMMREHRNRFYSTIQKDTETEEDLEKDGIRL